MAKSITEFGAVDKNFSTTVKQLEGRLEGFDGAVGGVTTRTAGMSAGFIAATVAVAAMAAAFVGAAVVVKASLDAAMDFANQIEDLKRRTGELGSTLVLLQRGFELAGTGAENVEPALIKINKLIGEAGTGGKRATETLALLGLSLAELKTMSPSEALDAVARKIAELPTEAERTAAAIKVFGEGLGPKMLPYIEEFSKHMETAKEQLGSFPRIIGQYGPALDDLKNNLDAIGNKFLEFAVGLSGPIAAGLKTITDELTKFDAAAIGEKLGNALRSALYVVAEFGLAAGDLLAGIWDASDEAFMAFWNSVKDAFSTLYQTVEPVFKMIVDAWESIDWYAAGRKIGESITYAFDLMRGLFADPGQIFSLYGSYLNYTWRKAADDLLSSLVTASELVINIWKEFAANSQLWTGMAKMFESAMILGVVGIGKALLHIIDTWIDGLVSAWNWFTSEGVTSFGQKLLNMVKDFGKDFINLLTNPIGFIAGKFSENLGKETNAAANQFNIAYDQAQGSVTEKMRAGLDAAGKSATDGLIDGAQMVGNAFKESLQNAFAQTEVFESNVFGSKEAFIEMKTQADAIAERGTKLRLEAEAARDALESAKGEVKLINDMTTGPEGMATKTTQAASAVEAAGEKFAREVRSAGEDAGNSMKRAVEGITNAVSGFATEQTMGLVLSELRTISRRLPQAVIS